MTTECNVGEIADVGQCREIVAKWVEADLDGDFLREELLLDANFVEPQVLALPENFLIREVAPGFISGQIAPGAVGHGETRDGVLPNIELVEIEAEAEVDLLSIGSSSPFDAPRV